MRDPTATATATANAWRWHEMRQSIAARCLLLWLFTGAMPMAIIAWQTADDPLYALRWRVLLVGVVPAAAHTVSVGYALGVLATRDPAVSRIRARWQALTFALGVATYLIAAATDP
ncbi:hypothetical protein [Hamadaea tsunoensis]|uniref:hypothetical protein n=1 Tax=Hamadaea tsunoensis TaxID=53368 RepID=UPI00042830E7|nr:hypothetical protein [Hamadaea tsunoensis]